MFTKLTISAALAASLVAATAGCGGTSLDQAIVVGGSPSSQPFVSLAVDRFAKENALARFDISMAGSVQGLGKLCDGLVDMAVTAREIAPNETEACSASGIPLAKIAVARDAIVLFTNKNNPANVSCLSLPQIYSLVGPESTGIDSWNGGTSLTRALGEKRTLPGQPLTLIGPPPTSGTVDLLVDQTIAPFAATRKRGAEIRPDYRALASDAMIPGEVARQRNSIGFADFEKATRWRDQVRFLEINSGRGCVPANASTIRAGDYALSRSQLLYVNTQAAAANPTLAAFVSFALEP
ncbi:MAG: substrate-binding domain-containing protein, partial [Solirubrobacteraceae bacterium]|nr:substrate-binding domain-containing protein [Solirubrobacteraceae bacterium]